MARARKVLKHETIAIIGYGVQGPAQALNLRDNGFNVIIGNRPAGKGWNRAKADGWKPGKTLFDIKEAVQKGTVIQMLVSDAAQRETLADRQKTPKARRGALFFPRLFHRLQKADRRHPAEERGRDHGGARRVPA